ncbi:translational machinery component [Patellaria atrata CBS 101060]|uniref:Small ribosomal subunit protein uS11m n=1 Tax=Patellaria atrata CBS 101060 TaxID=1346257 RepID=A0A9P4SHJ3_9PEZI|nr:translational machinery component [Patellaria atrata CBS 101060]
MSVARSHPWLGSSVCAYRPRAVPRPGFLTRAFSEATTRKDGPRISYSPSSAFPQRPSPFPNLFGRHGPKPPLGGPPDPDTHLLQQQHQQQQQQEMQLQQQQLDQQRHYLHVYATKHNTHITLAKPDHGALISVSCGNIGFRKAARGNYDSAYQLAAYVMSTIQEKGLLVQIQKLELVLRGFGAGRDAVTKALLGTEGRNLRGKVIKVSDATRLKFGGSRSRAIRRLG